MSESESGSTGPYLFDVGVVALAHADTPVSERPLSYVRRAVTGEIDAVVPYPAVFGAHTVLTTYYGYSNAAASRLLDGFTDARQIDWYGDLSEETVDAALSVAGNANLDAWDGLYARVALETGVETILTIDDDFERVDGVETEVVLDSSEFERLNEFLDD